MPGNREFQHRHFTIGHTGEGFRRVACLSTSRADAGIYRPVIAKLIAAGVETHCIAGGTHLDPLFGRSIDGFRDIRGLKVTPAEQTWPGDAPQAVAQFAGSATEAFGRALATVDPDLVIVLGDRIEMLAATLAAVPARIPIAHLHGGERTLGAYDDKCRNAISMLADYHFPAHPEYAGRLRSLGIDPERIVCAGAPALDAIRNFAPLPLSEVHEATRLDLNNPTIIVLMHPETLGAVPATVQVNCLIGALERVPQQLLICGANADVARNDIADSLESFAAARGNARIVASASQRLFFTCMSRACCMVGNSSSGIIEAASFRLPVVNIGARQQGRIRAGHVIDVPFHEEEIHRALVRAMSSTFRESLANLVNPYGDGHAAERIVGALTP